MTQNIKIFLTEETNDSLARENWFLDNPGIFEKDKDKDKDKDTFDWQAEFCKSIDYEFSTIPWNLIRAKAFELPTYLKTIVCCDPISIQMTHRGAYCWGQQKLNISHQDALRIVAKINEVLMDDGEKFLLLDNLKWLYISEKEFSLNERSFEYLIGKDLFEFKYQGQDSKKWHSLATEIQMLITQLLDYGQLELAAGEQDSTIAVHFWGTSNLTYESALNESKLTPTKSKDIYLLSNMMVSFVRAIGYESKEANSLKNELKNNSLFSEDSMKEIVIVDRKLSDIILNLLSYMLTKSECRSPVNVKLITQNGIFQYRRDVNQLLSMLINLRKRVFKW